MLPATWAALAILLSAYSMLLVLLRQFGAAGIWGFCSIATIVANIQVLKVIELDGFMHPVPMGVFIFSTTFLASNLLNEYFGAAAARKGILISFATMLMFTFLMNIAIYTQPITDPNALSIHEAMQVLFMPLPGIFLASIIAYLSSQFLNTYLFQWVRKKTNSRFLWCRSLFATSLSITWDTTIFSLLAWRLFAAEPLPWEVVLWTYMLGSILLQLFLQSLNTPLMYMAQRCLPKTVVTQNV